MTTNEHNPDPWIPVKEEAILDLLYEKIIMDVDLVNFQIKKSNNPKTPKPQRCEINSK